MLKDPFKLTQIISLIAIIFYMYLKTKDKIALYVFLLVAYWIIVVTGFRILYPSTPFPSPTMEYMITLFLLAIPALITFIFIFIEAEKDRKKSAENLGSIFTMNRSNIIFWSFIILLNLAGFILDMGK